MSTYTEKPNGIETNGARQRTRAATNGDDDDGHTSHASNEYDIERSDNPIQPKSHLDGAYRFKRRFLRTGKPNIGVLTSFKRLALSSWLNTFIIFIPLAWIGHFLNVRAHHAEAHEGSAEEHKVHPDLKEWPPVLTFVFCLLALMPLERLFEYGGEQMQHYLGKSLGDLLKITLNNAIEATLAIILLKKCELRLMQSTVVGVIVLHLLLIPGVSFVVGGSRVVHQELNQHITELNHSLLTIGVLTLIIPLAFFTALDRGENAQIVANSTFFTDDNRAIYLHISRGLAVILLLVYICSRIYIHNPPGDDNALKQPETAPEELKRHERHLLEADPEVNQYIIIATLIVLIAIMAATAEWLVESIEFVREEGRVTEPWFGTILLPFVSFAADGAVALMYFAAYLFRHFLGKPKPPTTLAEADAIDLSIQFVLFWMPFFVLLGWWMDRPFSLLFDLFEVSLAIGACFIVNYVTADAKTNWAEGVALLAFYFMIALAMWFYTGQPEMEIMSACSNVAQAITDLLAAEASGHGAAAEHATSAAAETVAHATSATAETIAHATDAAAATASATAEHAARALGLI
ncbi:hypothetical protein DL96DRAFT_1785625 [Flagelloscypha sp. PMI_526]|nr:hypothetical protein DL96DRAFT_1785625 [Flagelloscypha sp. PMI_526]